MNEPKAYLAKPQVVEVGRHQIKITPPNLKWWLGAIEVLTELYGRAKAIEKIGEFNALNIGNILRDPSIRLLNHLSLTINKRPIFPWRPRGSWIMDNLTPDELGVLIQRWIDVVDLENIKKAFRMAGEKAGMKNMLAKIPSGSPAQSSPSSEKPDGQ